MSRPLLTALISKFVFRENLTSEEQAFIRSDIGAEAAGAAAIAQSTAISTASADASSKAAAAQAASQPLDADLTAYANAANAAARRDLIGAAEAGVSNVSDSFSTITVTGQTSVIAGVPEAPLKFTPGSGLAISTDNVTKEITFSLYQTPAITAFAISAPAAIASGTYHEVGTVLPNAHTFTWATSNPDNITPNTIGITTTAPSASTLLTASANDGTQSVTGLGAPTTSPLTEAGKTYRITASQLNGPAITRDLTIHGVYPVFYGKTAGARPTATSGLVTSGSPLVTPSTGDVTLPFNSLATEHVWFAIPSASPTKTRWTDPLNASNTGTIGGAISPGGNLFPDLVTVTGVGTALWSGQAYEVYISNYPVAIASLRVSN